MGRGARGGRANVERGGTACRILTLEGSQRRTEEMFHESLQRAGRGVCRRRSMALLAWGSRPWLGAQGGKGVEWRSRAPMWCLGEAGPRTRDQLHPIAPVSWGCHGRQEDGKNARTAQLSCAPRYAMGIFLRLCGEGPDIFQTPEQTPKRVDRKGTVLLPASSSSRPHPRPSFTVAAKSN